MDQHDDISEMRSSVGSSDAVRNLGLTLATPMNTLVMSDEDLELFWRFVQTQDYMFSDFERGNREGFLMRLRDMRHLHLDLNGAGYCLILNAWCCDTPELHFCVWDPKITIQYIIDTGTQILNFVFREMKAARVTGMIPVNNKRAMKFATLMGFKYEGCMREAFLFFGHRYDVHCYGILQREWEQRQARLNDGRD